MTDEHAARAETGIDRPKSARRDALNHSLAAAFRDRLIELARGEFRELGFQPDCFTTEERPNEVPTLTVRFLQIGPLEARHLPGDLRRP